MTPDLDQPTTPPPLDPAKVLADLSGANTPRSPAGALASRPALSARMGRLLNALRQGAPASGDEARRRRERAGKIAQRAKWAFLSSLGLMLAQFALALNGVSLDTTAAKAIFCCLAAGLSGSFFCWMIQDDARRSLTPLSEFSEEVLRRALRALEASPSARRWRDEAVASGREVLLLDLHAMNDLLEQDERDALALAISSPAPSGS